MDRKCPPGTQPRFRDRLLELPAAATARGPDCHASPPVELSLPQFLFFAWLTMPVIESECKPQGVDRGVVYTPIVLRMRVKRYNHTKQMPSIETRSEMV